MPGYYYFDWTYVLLIVCGVIAMIAQIKVKGTFNKYSKIAASRDMTGAEAARMMLQENDINDVTVMPVGGMLTDHYDPRSKQVCLSEGVYDKKSVAAIAVACHECGHAIQHASGYAPLNFRHALFPVANIGSSAAIPLFLIGLVAQLDFLQTLGIIFFAFAVLFHVVTLPVEFNASARAMAYADESGLAVDREKKGVRRVLTAAAMTYVASTAIAVVNLLRLIVLRNRND